MEKCGIVYTDAQCTVHTHNYCYCVWPIYTAYLQRFSPTVYTLCISRVHTYKLLRLYTFHAHAVCIHTLLLLLYTYYAYVVCIYTATTTHAVCINATTASTAVHARNILTILDATYKLALYV
jgi:hypothetical protein